MQNNYVHRTFIMPTQKLRKKGVRRKLNVRRNEFAGKNVLLVDDSIVRGTTSKEIVLMAREAGAKKVYFASCAPPITHVHIYGIDLASSSELIAFNKGAEAVAQTIGADAVIYQSLEDLQEACAELSPRKNQRFEVGVFCGKYITPVDDDYFEHLESVRGEVRKAKVEETARRNLINGVAAEEEIRILANGAAVSPQGQIVPARRDSANLLLAQGGISPSMERKSFFTSQESNAVRSSQDISLDNLNDHQA